MSEGTTPRLPERAAPILAECAPLAERFAAADARLFLVGGIVRDLFGGARVAVDDGDLDFTTDASPAQVKAIVGPIADALWTQGERFGTIGATIAGRLIEITTHRAEAYDPSSRKPDVVFAAEVETDLSRRDFTINALAVEVTAVGTGDRGTAIHEATVIDPFGGLADLTNGVLRTPRSPSESFSDDPLRMLRAARFIARLGVVPDPPLVQAVTDMAARLDVVSAERVREELHKLLGAADPTRGLQFLIETGLSERFLPELVECADAEVVARMAGASPDPELRLAIVLASGGRSSARRRMRALRSSSASTARVVGMIDVANLLSSHGVPWTDGDIRRLTVRFGDLLTDGLQLAGHLGSAADLADLDSFARRRAGLDDDLAALDVPMDGDEVMARLGVGPGPVVGQALGYLMGRRLDDGPMTRNDAEAALDAWWAARGLR